MVQNAIQDIEKYLDIRKHPDLE